MPLTCFSLFSFQPDRLFLDFFSLLYSQIEDIHREKVEGVIRDEVVLDLRERRRTEIVFAKFHKKKKAERDSERERERV